MRETEIRFTSPELLARFLAEITRQGLTYTVRATLDGWGVTLTGGY